MAADSAPLDEDGLIRRCFAPLATTPGALGLKDDAATFAPPPGHEIVVTADALVAGVHYFPQDAAADVARKALRVNISDLVAKGSVPAAYILTLALGEGWNSTWVEAFAAGLGEDQARYGIALLGGDTVRTPGPTCISITAFGTVPVGRAPRRDGASVGDLLLVTGTIGDAALGLKLRLQSDLAERWGLSAAERAHLLDRYLLPQPDAANAPLVLRFASAAMDVSDGLGIDSSRLAAASGLSALIEAGKVPLSAAARRALDTDPALIETILTGGDDYEVLFTAPANQVVAVTKAFAEAGLAVACIGEMRPETADRLVLTRDGRPMALERLGFRHF